MQRKVVLLLVAAALLVDVVAARDRPAVKAKPALQNKQHSLSMFAAKAAETIKPMQPFVTQVISLGAEIKGHLVFYLGFSYALTIFAYCIYIYCASCPMTIIKQILPALFALLQVNVVAPAWVPDDNRRPALLKKLPGVLTATNLVGAGLVFYDLCRCFIGSLPALSAESDI